MFRSAVHGYLDAMTIPTTPEPEPGAPDPVPQPELHTFTTEEGTISDD